MPRSALLEALSSEAHIWLTSPVECSSTRGLEMLAPEELEQYERYRVERARAHYLSARVLVRSVLSRYVDVEPSAWLFERGGHGRPELRPASGLPPLRFNLSHTDGLVACLVTLQADAGVDAEDIRRCGDPRAVAKHYFSAGEAADVSALAGTQQRTRFFSYWTLKEAYIKARGLGKALSSKRFSFDLREPGGLGVLFDASVEDREEDWQFGLWRASRRHLLAAAIRKGRGTPRAVVFRRTVLLDDHFEEVELERLGSSSGVA